jgi:(2Fe-2S) ferredoxin
MEQPRAGIRSLAVQPAWISSLESFATESLAAFRMFPPRKHIFVCITQRPPTAGASCGGRGSRMLMDKLQLALLEHDLSDQVLVNGCTCLGPCEQGVNMVVYPDATYYQHVTEADLTEIVVQHLVHGQPVQRLMLRSGEPATS